MRLILNAKTALFGGVLASIGASACCVGPLLLLILGDRWSVDRQPPLRWLA
jgi:mercuric ion transport protein